MDVSMRTVATIVILAMIVLPATVLALDHLASPNLWFDESGQFWLSLGLHHYSAPLAPIGGWGQVISIGHSMNSDPGEYTFLLRGWIDLFGASPLALRTLSFLFLLLTPVIMILAARRCGANPIVAALAASVPLGYPMLLQYATEVRAYSMETCAVTFLFFLPCWFDDESPGWRVILTGCLAALLILSRYSAFLFGAAACIASLLPFHRWRKALTRAAMYSIPSLIAAIAAYLLSARFQANGSHRAPAYADAFMMYGKDTATRFAQLRANFLTPEALPITVFLVAAPLFVWLGPRSLSGVRGLIGRMAAFCALSVAFIAIASFDGRLPWEIHTRWSIGYQMLSACCFSTLIIVGGIYLGQKALTWQWKTLAVAVAACFAIVWSLQLKRAHSTERPYYETIGSHLEALARSPNAKNLKIFVQSNAIPTTRYLAEAGPLKGAFNYPGNFHFETPSEREGRQAISAVQYNVIVIENATFVDEYRGRVTEGNAELRASPAPSALMVLTKR